MFERYSLESRKSKFILLGLSLLALVLFNLRYCGEVETAERKRFEGWIADLRPTQLPENISISILEGERNVVFLAKDSQTRFQVMRILEVLREARVVGRVTGAPSGHGDRRIMIKEGDKELFSGWFTAAEVEGSPQLGVLVRLLDEYAAHPSESRQGA